MYVMKANRLYDFVQCQKPSYADIISIIYKPVRYFYREKRFDPEQRVNVNCQSEVLDAMHQLESVPSERQVCWYSFFCLATRLTDAKKGGVVELS